MLEDILDQKGASAKPEVNLRNPLHVGEKEHGFKTKEDVTLKPKKGYQWPPQKDFSPQKRVNISFSDIVISYDILHRTVFGEGSSIQQSEYSRCTRQ